MFIHGKTKEKYYSVREKINYYKKIINGTITDVSASVKRKAKLRLKSLNKINNQSYNEPKLIITDDKHFGNSISKPRLCVAYGEDTKNRIKVRALSNRQTKTLVLDNYLDREINERYRFIDKSDVYENKYISDVKKLTKSDIKKIKHIYE